MEYVIAGIGLLGFACAWAWVVYHADESAPQLTEEEEAYALARLNDEDPYTEPPLLP